MGEGLPEPKNDFEIVAPDEEEEPEDTTAMDTSGDQDQVTIETQMDDDEDLAFGAVKVDTKTKKLRAKEDMEDTIEKERRRAEKERQDKLNKRHLPVKRKLPRPTVINEATLRPTDTNYDHLDQLAYADELIKQETLKMLHHDALYYPSDNQIPP